MEWVEEYLNQRMTVLAVQVVFTIVPAAVFAYVWASYGIVKE